MNITEQASNKKTRVGVGSQRTYSDVVEYLDSHWTPSKPAKNLNNIRALDKALGSPSKSLNTIHVGGTNGKT